VETGRRRILEKAMEKYRFHLEPLSAPDGLLVEDDRLVGLRFRRTRMENGRPVMTDGTFERRGACVISSIGSIPDPIPGIPTKGELFAFSDWDWGRLPGYPNLFSVGNVVTGKGNIVASRKHATAVTREAIERFLGVADEEGHAGEEGVTAAVAAAAAEAADGIHAEIVAQAPLRAEKANEILARIGERQRAVGYGGDFAAWLEKVGPGEGP
jgi:hypothetical protein